MNRYISILVAFTIILFLGCNTNEQPKTKVKTKTTVKQVLNQDLPPIPEPMLKELWDKCDYIDYLFYKTNFTLSQNEQASIRQFITFLATAPANKEPKCESLARIFFQEKGEILREAEFYFQKGCTYLIFLENNKPKYSNQLTPQGKKFFMNLFKQAQN